MSSIKNYPAKETAELRVRVQVPCGSYCTSVRTAPCAYCNSQFVLRLSRYCALRFDDLKMRQPRWNHPPTTHRLKGASRPASSSGEGRERIDHAPVRTYADGRVWSGLGLANPAARPGLAGFGFGKPGRQAGFGFGKPGRQAGFGRVWVWVYKPKQWSGFVNP